MELGVGVGGGGWVALIIFHVLDNNTKQIMVKVLVVYSPGLYKCII